MQFDPTRVGPVAIGVIAVLLAMSVASIGLIVERLVTTAFGLFVALPAIWAYNSFLSRIEGFRVELERSSYQLLRHLARS